MTKVVLISAGILSLMLTLSTLFIPVTLTSQKELEAVWLGYPFSFVAQDFSRYTPLFFPVQFDFGSPWEDPLDVKWLNFFGSWAVFFCGMIACFLLHRRFFG